MKDYAEKRRAPKDFPTAIYESSTPPPQFFHPEVNNFYKYSDENIPDDILSEIINLPRQTLIEDLIKVVEDGIKRYDWYRQNYQQWNGDEQNFLVHALHFLGVLKAGEAAEKVLDLLRQGDEFLNYWFADCLFDFDEDFYQIFQNKLDLIRDFLCERNVASYGKTAVSNGIIQVAIQQPERKPEVIAMYRAVIQHFIDNEKDDDLIDTSLLGGIVTDIVDFRGVELLDIIKIAFSKNLVDEQIMGDYNKVEKEIKRPFDPHDKLPIAPDILQRYKGDYLLDRPKRIISEEDRLKFKEIEESDSFKNVLNMFAGLRKKGMDGEDDYDEDDDYDDYEDLTNKRSWGTSLPVKRDEPKVGRNDPCPCGSGKKYKKCHGK
jgi:hypothetical protein